MVKKQIFCGHFEQTRHFETKQNSNFLKTGGYSPYIEVVFLQLKIQDVLFHIYVFVKPDFCKKKIQFYIHRGRWGQRIISISVLNDRAKNFIIENHV
jgi:hypothetical protein